MNLQMYNKKTRKGYGYSSQCTYEWYILYQIIFSSHILRIIARRHSDPHAISWSTLEMIAETMSRLTCISVVKWYQNPSISRLLPLKYINPQSLGTGKLKRYKHLLNGSKLVWQTWMSMRKYSIILNKVFVSKFCNHWIRRQTPEEGRMNQRQKRCQVNNQYDFTGLSSNAY